MLPLPDIRANCAPQFGNGDCSDNWPCWHEGVLEIGLVQARPERESAAVSGVPFRTSAAARRKAGSGRGPKETFEVLRRMAASPISNVTYRTSVARSPAFTGDDDNRDHEQQMDR